MRKFIRKVFLYPTDEDSIHEMVFYVSWIVALVCVTIFIPGWTGLYR